MSQRRENYLVSTILPLNWGMTYEDWLHFYHHHPCGKMLCSTDPATWAPEDIAEVNRVAQKEKELHGRLMALPDQEFYAEVDRLEKLGKQSDANT